MDQPKRLPLYVWVVLGLASLGVAVFALGPDDLLPRLYCLDGEIVTEETVHDPYPGKTVTEFSMLCVEGEQRRDISGPTNATMAILVASIIVVPVVTVLVAARKRRP